MTRTIEEIVKEIEERTGQKVVSVHVIPKAPICDHEWNEDRDAPQPTHCVKCGYSFTRYIHMDCP